MKKFNPWIAIFLMFLFIMPLSIGVYLPIDKWAQIIYKDCIGEKMMFVDCSVSSVKCGVLGREVKKEDYKPGFDFLNNISQLFKQCNIKNIKYSWDCKYSSKEINLELIKSILNEINLKNSNTLNIINSGGLSRDLQCGDHFFIVQGNEYFWDGKSLVEFVKEGPVNITKQEITNNLSLFGINLISNGGITIIGVSIIGIGGISVIAVAIFLIKNYWKK